MENQTENHNKRIIFAREQMQENEFVISSSTSETSNQQLEQQQDDNFTSLEPETRLGMAVYLFALNNGIMTEAGVLVPNALNMLQLAKQAEISANYAIKALANLRKLGFIKNRKTDGRLIIKFDLLEQWLKEKGCPIED